MISPSELETLKFHWDVWKSESRAFWGRAILGSAILAVSMLFQFGIVTLTVGWVQLNRPEKPQSFYFFVNVFSWFLLAFLGFKFVDLLRHRIPEKYEGLVHNNFIPIAGRPRPLRWFGRVLYTIFIAYAFTVAYILGY